MRIKTCRYIIQMYISEFICASSARSELTMNQVSVFFLCFVWFIFEVLLGLVNIYGHESKETNIWRMLDCFQCDVCGVISFAAIDLCLS